MQKLEQFDAKTCDPKSVDKAKGLMENYTEDGLKKQSMAAASFYRWVRIQHNVEPSEKHLVVTSIIVLCVLGYMREATSAADSLLVSIDIVTYTCRRIEIKTTV